MQLHHSLQVTFELCVPGGRLGVKVHEVPLCYKSPPTPALILSLNEQQTLQVRDASLNLM